MYLADGLGNIVDDDLPANDDDLLHAAPQVLQRVAVSLDRLGFCMSFPLADGVSGQQPTALNEGVAWVFRIKPQRRSAIPSWAPEATSATKATAPEWSQASQGLEGAAKSKAERQQRFLRKGRLRCAQQ